MRTRAHAHTHTHTCTHTAHKQARAHMHTYIRTCIHTYLHARMHKYTYACIETDGRTEQTDRQTDRQTNRTEQNRADRQNRRTDGCIYVRAYKYTPCFCKPEPQKSNSELHPISVYSSRHRSCHGPSKRLRLDPVGSFRILSY